MGESIGVMITGGLGFVGQHLSAALISLGKKITTVSIEPPPPEPLSRHFSIDISEEKAVRHAFEETSPKEVFHLAAISLPKAARTNPRLAHDVNVWGTRNILEAASHSKTPVRILNVSTSQVYAMRSPAAIDESTPVEPEGEYATTKAMSELLRWQYASRVQTVTVRPFNHSGPGQAPSFVLSYLAQQFALIEAGQQEPIIVTGNLEVERDFADVRDVVQAYIQLMDAGQPGEVYNVCSGQAHRLSRAVEVLKETTGIKTKIVTDEGRVRPGEPQRIVGSFAKLQKLTGWNPKISFEEMMVDSLNYWRIQCKSRAPQANSAIGLNS